MVSAADANQLTIIVSILDSVLYQRILEESVTVSTRKLKQEPDLDHVR